MSNQIKRLYLVRHGETTGNRDNIHQDPDTPLSPKGEEQAAAIAKRFLHIPIDVIAASTFRRTTQTAEAVSSSIGKKIVYSELLREVKRPSELVGKDRNGEYARSVFQQIFAHDLDPKWHFSDEENSFDLEMRARETLSFLSGIEGKNVAVVSHGLLIKMLLSVMACESPEDAIMFAKRLYFSFILYNTGMTIADYENVDGSPRWRIKVWNDLAHLGE
ncbi:histidine phosphatase family protein [bacterium]|nr:histidine phosphatase family protein [bacterium]